MLKDVKSSYILAVGVASNLGTPATVNGAQVDHSMANSASFLIDVGAVTGTVDAKVQHSPDGTTWTDDDGASGNDTAIVQLTSAGNAQLNVVNPQARYSRCVVTIGGTNANYAVMNVSGPRRTIIPTDL